MKKITSIILCVVMVFSVCTITYAQPFSDITEEFSWAREAIQKFSERNIISGVGGGLFEPKRNVTRAEFAKMLSLAFEIGDGDIAIDYEDVSTDSWEYAYIKKAAPYTLSANMIDKTVAKNFYLPSKNASRLEIAAALVNIIGIDTENKKDVIKDAFGDATTIEETLYPLINAAVSEGLIIGYEDNTLRVKNSVTRAEAVVLIDRAVEYKNENKNTNDDANIAEGNKQPVSPEKTPAPALKPVATQDLVNVVDVEQTVVGNERYYLLYYAFRGVVEQEPLMVRTDAEIGGTKTVLSDICAGDVILYDFHPKGHVNAVRVVYSPGESANYIGKLLGEVVSTPSKMNWGLYNDGKNVEVLFGKISHIKSNDNGLILTLDYNGDTNQAVFLPYDTKGVSVYKPYMAANNKMFSPLIVQDIVSECYKEEGDYIFIKIKREVITDVMVIDYNR